MHIGLPGQRIETSLGGFDFEIDPDRKHALIHGLDDISVSEARLPDIERFEQRSEEHTSELQSLMRISYAVFCLKKKKNTKTTKSNEDTRSNYKHHTRHTY